MNKKEIAELKKNFTDESGLFVIKKLLMAFVNAENSVLCKNTMGYMTAEPCEKEMLLECLKKVISGTLGKNLVEYAFPNESYQEGGAQHTLYRVLSTGFEDDEATDEFLKRIAASADMGGNYAVISAVCTYSVPKKNKNDDILEDTDNDYKFIVTALCPANTGETGYFYDGGENNIEKKCHPEMMIARVPQDGFLFPVFSDRAADVNSVMYYTRSPKKPNLSVIEDVLEGTFSFSCNDEKEKFRSVVAQVCHDELSYSVITQVNDIIEDIVAQNKNETEPTMINAARLKSILGDAGISDERLEAVDAVYEAVVGEFELTASNLIESKTTLAAESITVNIGKDATDKVRTMAIQGRKCLVIDLDDPTVTINGIDTKVVPAEG